jgi:hypothetical protein
MRPNTTFLRTEITLDSQLHEEESFHVHMSNALFQGYRHGSIARYHGGERQLPCIASKPEVIPTSKA